MLTSVLSPISIATPDTAPPWGWNPAATFLTAYNTQAQERRDQEKFNMAMQLERILLPAKRAEAEYNIKKLQLDSEFLTTFHRARTAALPGAYRGINQAVSGSGGSAGATTPPRRQGLFRSLTQQIDNSTPLPEADEDTVTLE